MAKKKALKETLEQEIADMLAAKDKEPSEGRIKVVALGIKMCALNAKLEENEYGDFFNDEPGSPAGSPQGPKAGTGKRAPDA